MQQSKIDSVVNKLIDGVSKSGKGFVLDLAASQREKIDQARDELLALAASGDRDPAKLVPITARAIDALDGTSIEVRESLSPVDEYVLPAQGRQHIIDDTASFIAYALKYGDKTKSLVFYNQDGATLTIDETIERGEREIVKMCFSTTDEWTAWSGMIARPVKHKDLFKHCMLFSHTLESPEVLNSMRQIKTNSIVNNESDIQDDSKTVGVMIKTTKGEELAKFPKEIKLCVPILEQDLSDSEAWAKATVRLDIELPDDPRAGVVFTLHCSGWNLLMRERTQKEALTIAKELDGYTVLRGHQSTFAREIGRDND